jgi:HlyD family secretion protein
MTMEWGTRRHSLTGLATVVCLTLGIGVWGAWASLAGAVVAHGQVEVRSHSQVVQHPDGGVVAAINVRDGDSVTAGDPLILLDAEALRSDERIVATQLVDLKARAVRLKAERDSLETIEFPSELMDVASPDKAAAEAIEGQASLFEARAATLNDTMRSYSEQKTQIANEIEGQKGQLSSLDEQIGLLADELINAETLLADGLMEEPRVQSLKREKARLSGLKSETKAAIASNLGRMAQLDVEVVRLKATRREEAVTELREVQGHIAELEEQLGATQTKLSRLALLAPMSGVVHDLRIHTVGAVIRPADPVLFIVPQDEDLTVSARIDVYHIDSLFVGQEAVLKFSAFNARTTPELKASVRLIAPDIKTDERTGLQYYLTELQVRPDESAKLAGQPLIPGMPVEVFIQTGERSPLSYIMKPFMDYFEHAFRE